MNEVCRAERDLTGHRRVTVTTLALLLLALFGRLPQYQKAFGLCLSERMAELQSFYRFSLLATFKVGYITTPP